MAVDAQHHSNYGEKMAARAAAAAEAGAAAKAGAASGAAAAANDDLLNTRAGVEGRDCGEHAVSESHQLGGEEH